MRDFRAHLPRCRARRFFGADALTSTATRAAAEPLGSHSQTTTNFHPASRSRRSVSSSRSRLLRSLLSHHWRFASGKVACSGHECQKQPLTSTATRCLTNTMSISRRVPGITRRCSRYRSPCACKSRRRASSGPVSRSFWSCIARRLDEGSPVTVI